MRRIIELSVEQDRNIVRLVEAGRYEDVQHFVTAAIENQLILERADSGAALSANAADEAKQPADVAVEERQPVALEAVNAIHPLGAAELARGEDAARWLWGQINSVLAIKFVCREVAYAGTSSGPQPLRELAAEIAKRAAAFGHHLRFVDAQQKHGRGENLATSFPTLEEKSLSRFANHYVGSRRADGRYDGALFQLGLLSADHNDRPGLTGLGARFATLPSPVIDRSDNRVKTWLSEDEEAFYLQEVAARMSVERIPMSWVLLSVQAGANTRTTMNERLAAAYPAWTPAEVETYRVGTLSRLVQLRVLVVIRNGRDIRYELGPNSALAVQLFKQAA